MQLFDATPIDVSRAVRYFIVRDRVVAELHRDHPRHGTHTLFAWIDGEKVEWETGAQSEKMKDAVKELLENYEHEHE